MTVATGTRRLVGDVEALERWTLTLPDVRTALQALDCRIWRDDGRSFDAQCPLADSHQHGDRKPSLSVGTAQDGRVLLNCHRGCDREDVRAAFLVALAPLPPRSCERSSSSLRGSSHTGRTRHIEKDHSDYPAPKPGGDFSRNKGDSGDSDELEATLRKLADYDAGRLWPDFEVPLRIDRLPRQAATLRSLAERVALVMAFRLTSGDTRALPIAGTFAARLLGRDPERSERDCRGMLASLVRCGVLRECEPLERRGKGNGTRTFQPADFSLAQLFDGGELQPDPVALELVPEGPRSVGARSPMGHHFGYAPPDGLPF